MNGTDILTLVTVFVLSAFVGFEVISKVPSILHTPLMSGTNAIHGVVLVGSMAILGTAQGGIEITLGFIAVVLSTVNVVGGFVVTDRMLEMFKGRQPGRPAKAGASEPALPDPALPEPTPSPAPPQAPVAPAAAPKSPAAPLPEAPVAPLAAEPGVEEPSEPTQFLRPEDMPAPPYDSEATEVLPRPPGSDETQLIVPEEEGEQP